ncbi:MAG: hypothetical protein ACI9FN_000141 [Saprospiraceae bacterium]|jgi:hypothetical protein
MKYCGVVVCLLILCLSVSLNAQDKKPLSPPVTINSQIGETKIEINYNAPSKRGRQIWGDLVPFGQVWRTGANSATKITIDRDLKIKDQSLPAGTYSLFSIPDEQVWTIIFNTVADQWGHFKYDASKDALRVKVIPVLKDEAEELMAIAIIEDQLKLSWDKLSVSLPLSE